MRTVLDGSRRLVKLAVLTPYPASAYRKCHDVHSEKGQAVRYVVNWPARMEEIASFVGLDEEARGLIRASAPIVARHAQALTDAVYDHFLGYPQARKFFVTESGEVDEERLSRRKHTLVRWLRETAAAKLDESFAGYLLAMGVSHGYPSAHREHLGPVPSRFIIGTMSFAQSAIGDLLLREMDDAALALRTSLAWNKILMVELVMLLAGYLDEPEGPS